MTTKVIQWSTGNVGGHALAGIIEHQDLELAGLWVHSADKVGRDAGELAGLDVVTGVLATDDAEALLKSDAEVVCYTATADLRPQQAVEDCCRILRAGKNVVSSSLVMLVWPRHVEAWFDELQEAAIAGNASMFTSGIDPGWANDLLPLTLTGTCSRVDSVRIQEILNYDTYDQATVLFDTMGFAQPLDAEPLLLLPGSLSLAWGSTLQVLAAGLGVELDEIREVHERVATPRELTVPAGTVPAGTTAALRFEVQGIVDGEPKIIVEHVTRLADDLAPEWPTHPHGGGYRVEIDGYPSYRLDVSMDAPDGDHNTGGLRSTAMRLLNAVPAVIDAEPGLLSPLDLPIIGGVGTMVGKRTGD